jgi:hypothetical protein
MIRTSGNINCTQWYTRILGTENKTLISPSWTLDGITISRYQVASTMNELCLRTRHPRRRLSFGAARYLDRGRNRKVPI